jgi:hypothetical protein
MVDEADSSKGPYRIPKRKCSFDGMRERRGRMNGRENRGRMEGRRPWGWEKSGRK